LILKDTIFMGGAPGSSLQIQTAMLADLPGDGQRPVHSTGSQTAGGHF
jgi:hypothetical protein